MSDDKVAIITGGGSGIGASTALQFAKLGYRVTINGRNEDKLLNCLKELKELGIDEKRVKWIVGDISLEEDAEKLVMETVNTFGRLDVLINNAGYIKQGSIEKSSLEDFDAMYRVHIRGPLHLSKLALPYLERTQGNIVNIGSGVAWDITFPSMAPYILSKYGLNSLTKLCAKEFSEKGVRVNCVVPGQIRTNLLVTSGFATTSELDKIYDGEAKLNLLKTIGESKQIAEAVTVLADSEKSSFTTGAFLVIDGGLNLTSTCFGGD